MSSVACLQSSACIRKARSGLSITIDSLIEDLYFLQHFAVSKYRRVIMSKDKWRYCISIGRKVILGKCVIFFVHVFLTLSMYSYCSSMYSCRCLCILIVAHVFLDAVTLTEVFPCFILGCKANARL